MVGISEYIKERRNFESLGLGKNKLRKLSCLVPFFEQCGRVKIGSEALGAYHSKAKDRENIIAKNNKVSFFWNKSRLAARIEKDGRTGTVFGSD
jgi:hypothetical protein